MTRALIADDEPHLARHLAEQLAALWPGLEVAQGIEGPTRVVFVTAYDDYAVAAFEHAALDYVLKPVVAARLQRAVERLAAALQRLLPPPAAPPLRWLRAGLGDLVHQVDVAEVLYFHADDKYTCARTAQAEHLLRTPIAELAARLDPARFWQIHRSTIVNLDHLAGTRRDDASRLFVRLRGSAVELPVARPYVPLFKAM